MRYHDTDEGPKECRADSVETCRAKKLKDGSTPNHYEDKAAAESAWQDKLAAENHGGHSGKLKKTTKKGTTKPAKEGSNRAFALYQSLQKQRRSSREVDSRSGSFVNHSIETTAKQLGKPVAEVKADIVKGYAEKHDISVDEATKYFDDQKAKRQAAHDEREQANGPSDHMWVGVKGTQYNVSKNYPKTSESQTSPEEKASNDKNN